MKKQILNFFAPFFLIVVLMGVLNTQQVFGQGDTNRIIVQPENTGIILDTSNNVNNNVINFNTGITGRDTTKPKGTTQQRKPYNKDDITSWVYFNVQAKAPDDSIFIQLPKDLGLENPPESYLITVNLSDPNIDNQWVYMGGEGNEGSKQYPWSILTPKVQQGLLNWKGANKENLTKTGYNYASVFVDAFKKIRFKDVLAPPQREREIVNSVAYINPYLNFFGADPLGLPIKRGFGFSLQLGTPYSGPFETDMVGANFHLLGASVGVTTRIKEFVFKRTLGATKEEKESRFGNYNNIYAPKLGLNVNYVIPFGNFFQIGYFTTLDTGDYDPPIQVKKAAITGDTTNMPNSNLGKAGYVNWEFRYPLRFFRSTRSKIYIAKAFGEFHAGFIGRELTLAGSVFDVRINATFGSARRNFQLLLEAYVSSISEGFSLSAFAIGPSIRLTKTPEGKMGVVTVMLNARLKIGDFWDEGR